jgi:hypothetical protein
VTIFDSQQPFTDCAKVSRLVLHLRLEISTVSSDSIGYSSSTDLESTSRRLMEAVNILLNPVYVFLEECEFGAYCHDGEVFSHQVRTLRPV